MGTRLCLARNQQAVENLILVLNLRLMPVFNEMYLDSFFSLFERVADVRGWLDSERTLVLQFVLTGKAQAAYVERG